MHASSRKIYRLGMGIREGTVVSFIPTLFGCFLDAAW